MHRDALHHKTLHRYEIAGGIRFLTFSCYDCLPLLGDNQVKLDFVTSVAAVRIQCRFRLFAWVVMPTHVHLLLAPDITVARVPRILWQMKKPFSQRIIRTWLARDAPSLARVRDWGGRVHFWLPGGGYDRNVDTGKSVEETRAYMHMNPVNAGLVERAIDYQWSSARQIEGVGGPYLLPIDPIDLS